MPLDVPKGCVNWTDAQRKSRRNRLIHLHHKEAVKQVVKGAVVVRFRNVLLTSCPWTTVEQSGPVRPLCQGTGTTHQADRVAPGWLQTVAFDVATFSICLSVIEHRIDRNGESS